MHEAVWCDTWIRYIYYSGSVVTNTYKLYIINQSINQECMSPLLEVILRTTDLHVSAKIRGHQYVHNSFKIINPSHPWSTSRPSSFHYSNIHFLVVLSLFMSSNLHIQFSCLLLIMSKMSSCPCHCLISSLLILSNLLTLWILLITLIWVAFSLAAALSDSTPHRHTTMRAPSWHWLQSVLCFYLAFCAYSRSCLQPFLQHLQFLPPLPSPSCMPSLLNIIPKYFISSTCSITWSPILTSQTTLFHTTFIILVFSKSLPSPTYPSPHSTPVDCSATPLQTLP